VVPFVAGCGAPRAPSLDPSAVTLPAAGVPRFVASGRARFESESGDVDGHVELRVDPPRRVRLELRADALFGLVGERVIVCLPGDGWLLTYEERADRIERVRIDESWLADLAPGGGIERVLELATARLPWPETAPAPQPRPAGDRLEIDLAPAGSAGLLRVLPGTHLLRRLEWRQEDRTRLEVEYGDELPCGSDWLPARLRGRAGDVRVDLRIDRVEPRSTFADSDFDLLGTQQGGDG
jgi:hypothetical protein